MQLQSESPQKIIALSFDCFSSLEESTAISLACLTLEESTAINRACLKETLRNENMAQYIRGALLTRDAQCIVYNGSALQNVALNGSSDPKIITCFNAVKEMVKLLGASGYTVTQNHLLLADISAQLPAGSVFSGGSRVIKNVHAPIHDSSNLAVTYAQTHDVVLNNSGDVPITFHFFIANQSVGQALHEFLSANTILLPSRVKLHLYGWEDDTKLPRLIGEIPGTGELDRNYRENLVRLSRGICSVNRASPSFTPPSFIDSFAQDPSRLHTFIATRKLLPYHLVILKDFPDNFQEWYTTYQQNAHAEPIVIKPGKTYYYKRGGYSAPERFLTEEGSLDWEAQAHVREAYMANVGNGKPEAPLTPQSHARLIHHILSRGRTTLTTQHRDKDWSPPYDLPVTTLFQKVGQLPEAKTEFNLKAYHKLLRELKQLPNTLQDSLLKTEMKSAIAEETFDFIEQLFAEGDPYQCIAKYENHCLKLLETRPSTRIVAAKILLLLVISASTLLLAVAIVVSIGVLIALYVGVWTTPALAIAALAGLFAGVMSGPALGIVSTGMGAGAVAGFAAAYYLGRTSWFFKTTVADRVRNVAAHARACMPRPRKENNLVFINRGFFPRHKYVVRRWIDDINFEILHDTVAVSTSIASKGIAVMASLLKCLLSALITAAIAIEVGILAGAWSGCIGAVAAVAGVFTGAVTGPAVAVIAVVIGVVLIVGLSEVYFGLQPVFLAQETAGISVDLTSK